jgi:hypothetical protein
VHHGMAAVKQLLGRNAVSAAVNHKRLYRLYRQEHLAVRRLRRTRLLRPGVRNAKGREGSRIAETIGKSQIVRVVRDTFLRRANIEAPALSEGTPQDSFTSSRGHVIDSNSNQLRGLCPLR